MKVIGRIVCIIGALAMVGAFILCVCTGCASVYTVQRHDRAVVERHALQAQAQPGGQGINFGVDVLGLTGYWRAWQDAPGAMAIATVADLATAIGVAAAGNAVLDDDQDTPKPVLPGSMGDDNTIIVGPVNGPLTIDQSTTGKE
jgi:hypothetical protein